jgi:hypothetical protein
MTHEEIAKVCHQANKAYCEALGDKSQPDWDTAPEWQKTSAIEGVKARAKHTMIAAAQMHNLWMQKKAEDGWSYGETKDPEKKTHPCMVPYKQLPVAHRIKDELFLSVAGTLLKAR